MKIVAQNKKAYHDYFILDTYEAGIELQGTEIKSIRKGSVNLKDSFIRIRNDEAFIDNMHIAPYEQGNRFNHEPLRQRKLLLHKKEIKKLHTWLRALIQILYFLFLPSVYTAAFAGVKFGF